MPVAVGTDGRVVSGGLMRCALRCRENSVCSVEDGPGWTRVERGRPVEMILHLSSCDQMVARVAETWGRV